MPSPVRLLAAGHERRLAHVGVNQQHSLARLRQGDRQVARNQALAFARAGARYDNGTGAIVRRREQDVGPHRLEGLGEVLRHAVVEIRGVREDHAQRERSQDPREDLRDPVHRGQRELHPSRHDEAERDGRVEMPSRDVTDG